MTVGLALRANPLAPSSAHKITVLPATASVNVRAEGCQDSLEMSPSVPEDEGARADTLGPLDKKLVRRNE